MPHPLRPRSIRSLLLLLALPFALAAFGLVAWQAVESRRAALDAAHERSLALAADTAARLSLALADAEHTLGILCDSPRVRALDPGDCDPVISYYVRLRPEFATLSIRDAQRRSICSYLPNPLREPMAQDMPWFDRALATGTFAVSDAFLGPTSGRWVAVTTHPVHAATGSVAGLAILPLDLGRLRQRVLPQLFEGEQMLVVDGSQRILLRSNDHDRSVGRPAPAFVVQHVAAAGEGFFSATDDDGVRRLHALVAVPGTGWKVLAALPEEAIFAAPWRGLAGSLAIVVPALLVLAALAARLARTVAEPMPALPVVHDLAEPGRDGLLVQQQHDELLRLQQAMLGREARILDLKGEVNRWLVECGRPRRYVSVDGLREAEAGGDSLFGPSVEAAIDLARAAEPLGLADTELEPRTLLSVVEDQQKAEQRLAKSEAFYRGLFENTHEGFAYCRVILEGGRACDWVYLRVNPSFERMRGTAALEGRRASEVVPDFPTAGRELLAAYGRVAATGRPETLEVHIDRLARWFLVLVSTPHSEHVVSTWTDITEAKLAQMDNAERLAELSRWYRATLGREDRVRELKAEVNALCRRLGQPDRYARAAAADEREHDVERNDERA